MKRGSITVFLALILSIVLVLTTACMESAKMAAARTQILNGADLGLYSLFGHYDRTMLEDYDLFLLYAGGNNGEVNLAEVYKVFEKYMKPVLKQNSQKLSMQQGGISGYQLLTDQNGEVFYQQIVQYMKDTLPEQGITLLLNKMEKNTQKTKRAEEIGEEAEQEDTIEKYEQEMQTAEEKSQELAEELQQNDTKEEFQDNPQDDWQGNSEEKSMEMDDVERIKNPIPAMKRLRKMSVLGLVLPENKSVSGKKVEKGKLLSVRTRNQGFQMALKNGPDYTPNSMLLYQTYLVDKLGNYSQTKKGALDYELEYILFGKDSDYENLSKVANRLLIIREGVNLTHILSDAGKKAEVHALAAAIASTFLVPPASAAIEGALCLCWAFAESVLDVRNLFDGKKAAVIKTNENWQLSLEQLGELLSGLDTLRKEEKTGLSYEDYLQILLWTESKNTKVIRGMEMIECDMREKLNSEQFGLDQCVCGLGISVKVKANNRKTYIVKREFRY
ncbi:MAG: DUF5702 domain-containing protein [Eubacteriales bacterium]|nr:DUF5702 domain-containing protein [Eubacteriales bacterium]